MALIIEIADAIVAELNDGPFSMPFAAVRFYLPVFELPDMTDLHVSVVPAGIATELIDRQASTYDCKIDIAIQKRVDPDDLAAVDGLMGLVEEIAAFFHGRSLESMPQVTAVAIETQPMYAQEHLSELRQFTSVLTVTFRTVI